MKRMRNSPEQIIRKLREADGWLPEGKTIGEIYWRLADRFEKGQVLRPGLVHFKI